MSTWEDVIRYLNARILASLALPPPSLGPEPLTCPVCGTTRLACVQFYGRDPVHEEQVRARLDEDARKIAGG